MLWILWVVIGFFLVWFGLGFESTPCPSVETAYLHLPKQHCYVSGFGAHLEKKKKKAIQTGDKTTVFSI